MKHILSRYGIPSLFETIKTPIPTNNTPTLIIASKMPTQIGIIYGLSLTVGGTDEDGNFLISYAQSALLYLNLKKGSSDVLSGMRLDKLVYNNPSATILPSCDNRYLDMIIPGNISLDQSNYRNPTGIVAVTTLQITLDLWYLDLEMTTYLCQKGAIDLSDNNKHEIGMKGF